MNNKWEVESGMWDVLGKRVARTKRSVSGNLVRSWKLPVFAGMTILGYSLAGHAADLSKVLKNNPFLTTLLEELKNSEALDGNAATNGKEAAKAGNSKILTVKAILASEHMSFANINGRLLKVGDEINGKTITNITEGQVELKKGKKRYILTTHALTEVRDDK